MPRSVSPLRPATGCLAPSRSREQLAGPSFSFPQKPLKLHAQARFTADAAQDAGPQVADSIPKTCRASEPKGQIVVRHIGEGQYYFLLNYWGIYRAAVELKREKDERSLPFFTRGFQSLRNKAEELWPTPTTNQ